MAKTKNDIIDAVASEIEVSKKDAKRVVDTVFEEIESELADGGQVSIAGFGKFEVRDRAARTGRNPQTGEELKIPASKAPAFRPGKALRDSVKG